MLLAAILSKKIYDSRVADRERNEPWVLATELDHVKTNAFEKVTVNGEMLFISEICVCIPTTQKSEFANYLTALTR
jgi:hypothetical protein